LAKIFGVFPTFEKQTKTFAFFEFFGTRLVWIEGEGGLSNARFGI